MELKKLQIKSKLYFLKAICHYIKHLKKLGDYNKKI